MRYIPFDELDQLLQYFDDGYSISHDEAYRRFSEVCLMPPDNLPNDPFSPEYADIYLGLYKKLSQRSAYSVQNERSEFDVEQRTLRPYPYFTKSLKRTAQHYGLMASLMEIMELQEGASILECGFGWGNTTVAFAMLGYNVTALDIEERYCEVVRRRAVMLNIGNIELINSDFLWVESADRQFDAIVFFESFHHCWEFERLLRALHNVLAPGGRIYFGAEPINEEFSVPWGIRLDGESLFVARRAGWMELGFHSDFFDELLARTGWRGQCIHHHFWVAARKNDPIIITGKDLRLKSQVGERSGEVLNISAPSETGTRYFAIFGPYIGLGRGSYRVDLTLSVDKPYMADIVFDVCHNDGKRQIYQRTCTSSDFEEGVIRGEFSILTRVTDLEVRLNVPAGFACTIDRLEIACLD